MSHLNAPDLSPMPPGIAKLRVAAVAAILPPLLVWSAGAAQAAALGKMTVLSTLGSRFEAVVQLVGDSGDGKRTVAECFRLGQSGEGDLPTLRDARLTVEESEGRLQLRISSDQTINDPLLQVNVRVGCGSEVGRNYVLLIDPPNRRAQPPTLQRPQSRDRQLPATPGAPAPLAAPATIAVPPGRQPAPTAAAVTRNQTAAASTAAELPRSSTPAREPSRRATAAGKAGDRLFLSAEDEVAKALPGDDHPLRLSTRLSTELLGKISESQRAMLRIEYQLLAALHTQAAQQLAIAQQIRHLEGTLEDLHRKSAAQSPPATAPLVTAAAPAAAADSERPSRPPQEPSAVKARAPLAPAAAEADWWFEASLLLGLIAALAWFLRRRSVTPPSSSALTAPVSAPDSAADDSRWELQVAEDGSRRQTSGATGTAADGLISAEDGRDESAPLPVREAGDDVTAVLELTEIMLSFGRTKGAQRALEEFVEQQPMAAVTPWLKLLEVYRQGNERAAFESLALKLTSLFNVAAPDWQGVEESPAVVAVSSEVAAVPIEQLLVRLPSVGRMTHIRRELVRLWDSPDCPAYLDKLLRDNRNGERRGFELGTVRELLVLTDIQYGRRRPVT